MTAGLGPPPAATRAPGSHGRTWTRLSPAASPELASRLAAGRTGARDAYEAALTFISAARGRRGRTPPATEQLGERSSRCLPGELRL
jgi:hypothetical protein